MCAYCKPNNLELYPEAVAQRCSIKKGFLEFSQSSQENNRAKVSFFNKFAGAATLLKKETLAQGFS